MGFCVFTFCLLCFILDRPYYYVLSSTGLLWCLLKCQSIYFVFHFRYCIFISTSSVRLFYISISLSMCSCFISLNMFIIAVLISFSAGIIILSFLCLFLLIWFLLIIGLKLNSHYYYNINNLKYEHNNPLFFCCLFIELFHFLV